MPTGHLPGLGLRVSRRRGRLRSLNVRYATGAVHS